MPWIARALLWMLSACLLPTLLHAAGPSFDCRKAHGLVERAVCGSAELSRLDRTLADAYQARGKAAAGAETVPLRDAQRQWLAARVHLCFPAGRPLPSSPANACLALLYRNRTAELQSDARPAEYWQAYSHTAMAITGDLLLSAKSVVMAGGYELALEHVKHLPQNGEVEMGGFEDTRSLDLYRIVDAKPRTLLNGNTLCGAQETPTYVVEGPGKDGSTMSLAFFTGASAPLWEKQALSTTHALCGTFSYGRAPDS